MLTLIVGVVSALLAGVLVYMWRQMKVLSLKHTMHKREIELKHVKAELRASHETIRELIAACEEQHVTVPRWLKSFGRTGKEAVQNSIPGVIVGSLVQ